MTVTRRQIGSVLATVLSEVPDSEIRLVGTASCVLRGIDMPAGDVDILFRDRGDIDTWVAALRIDHEVETAPSWEEDSSQYFARIRVDDVNVELSTVEVSTDSDTTECFGDGPWKHFDILAVDGRAVPAVRLELRLITELARGREDRYRPIIEYLRTNPYDEGLIRRGLMNVGASESSLERVLEQLKPEPPGR